MRAIIGNLLYDTARAKKIFSFRRKVKGPDMALFPGYCFVEWCDIDIYKTASGRWFEHNKDKETITPTKESNVKEITSRLDPKRYIEFFGNVKEA